MAEFEADSGGFVRAREVWIGALRVEEFARGDEVAFALADFVAFEGEEGGVDPLAGELIGAGEGSALGDLALVVGELVVLAAGVEVDRGVGVLGGVEVFGKRGE